MLSDILTLLFGGFLGILGPVLGLGFYKLVDYFGWSGWYIDDME